MSSNTQLVFICACLSLGFLFSAYLNRDSNKATGCDVDTALQLVLFSAGSSPFLSAFLVCPIEFS